MAMVQYISVSSEISTKGDVYFFGILILEMLTGKRPTKQMFKDGNNLHSYVKTAYPNNLLEIVGSALLPQQIQQRGRESEKQIMENLALLPHYNEKFIISLFDNGLACSVESPKEGLNMMDVMRELNKIINPLHGSERNGK